MKKYNYFEVPTQVKFWDIFSKGYVGGIAFRDKIICGCCGGVASISDVYMSAPDALKEGPIVVYDNWVDISQDICGDNN